MKKGKLAAIILLTAALCLSGCGGSNSSSGSSYNAYSDPGVETGSYSQAAKDYAAPAAAEESVAYEADEMAASEDAAYAVDGGGGQSGSEENGSALRAQDGQKIVYTGSLSIQTLEYDKSAASIRRKIREAGGFSESENEYDKDYNWYRNTESRDSTRSLSITARIPSNKFESFLDSLSGDGKIMNRSVNAQNISQVYANKETYKKALEKEQERLLAMMDKAETIEDMITVESRLSDVERQLNAYKTDLAQMDKDVEYSTVYIELQEVKRYTPTVQKTTFGERLRFAFEDAVTNFKDFCEGIILFFVRNFPFLILLAILIALFIRWLRKRRAQKIALLTNPEYAKVMTAKVQAKADAAARKQAMKEERRRNRGGLFGAKKDGGTAPAAPAAEPEKPQADAPAGPAGPAPEPKDTSGK